jgi:electron transport complex protein RnfD
MNLYMQPVTGGASFVSVMQKATLPLEAVRADLSEVLSYPNWDLFIGFKPGAIGEVCILALLLGGVYLLVKRVITWHAPAGCLVGAAVFGLVFHWIDPEVYAGPTFHLLNGGLVLAAFFLATDKGTTPVTERGMVISGLMIGMLTMLIRYLGSYVDGVYFAVLLTNAVTPILDRLRPNVYGRVKEVA